MKKLFAVCFACVFGCALFAARPNHTIMIYPKPAVPLEIVDKGGAAAQELSLKNGGKYYRFYFCAENPEWQEVKFIVKPSADCKLRFNLRAPKQSVAEFGSFQVNGTELLEETPAVSPYSKGQPGITLRAPGKAGETVTIVAKIRKSAKTPDDFK